MILRPGTYLQKRYEILEQIGAGGMSEVYKAKCHILNRLVAIKVLKEEFCSDAGFVKKFKMEAQAAAGLSHPNIVNIYDVVDEGNLHYIVMELIEGITLKQYIKNKGHLDIREATGIAIQVAQGISAAHERKIVHRDIKPQNMILSKDGKVKVADFGIARAISSQTQNSNAVGSVHYISPEQAKGELTDERSDIYSLGITIYEMVTGRLPYEGDNSVTVAIAHLEETITPPSVYNPEIPGSLEKIILKCTEKDPDNRYQDVKVLISDLRESLLNPEEEPPSIVKGTGHSGDTRILDTKEMTAIRSVAGKKKNERNLQGHADGDDEEEEEEGGGRINRVITGAAIIIAIVLAAAFLFFLIRFSGMFNGGKNKTTAAATSVSATVPSGSISEKETYMPYVIGLTQAAAEKALKDSNLQMTISGSDYSEQFAKDMVMAQSPEAGKVIAKYSKVEVKISLGSNKVDLSALGIAGMNAKDAQTILEKQGLTVTSTEAFSDTVAAGKVISFTPAKAEKGSAVVLTVSKGREVKKATVPDLTGLTEEVAIGKLSDAGLKPGKAKAVPSDTVQKGLVTEQGTPAGTEVDEGTSITYSVSSGPLLSSSATTNPTVQPITGTDSASYKYVASIDSTYNLTDLIGPGSNTTSFKVMIRLKQTVNGQTVYKTLMDPRVVTGNTILPVRFKSIEGAYGVDTGEVQVVRADSDAVLKSYEVQFFKVQ